MSWTSRCVGSIVAGGELSTDSGSVLNGFRPGSDGEISLERVVICSIRSGNPLTVFQLVLATLKSILDPFSPSYPLGIRMLDVQHLRHQVSPLDHVGMGVAAGEHQLDLLRLGIEQAQHFG